MGSDDSSSTEFRAEKQVDAPATIGEGGNRRWIYPDRRGGARATRRKQIAIGLIIFYFVAPWLEFSGRPLLRVDVLNQKAYFFGLVLQMSEFNLIFFALAILGMVLFLVTSIQGRIWCGYACPQTVFVEWVIRPIEEFFEGPALKRRKQDSEPKTLALWGRKFAKHISFALVSLLVANAFLGFFIDPRTVLHWIFSPPGQHLTAFSFVVFVTLLMYFDLSWFREQFCTFLCPYARFQSVMLDQDSLAVTYDQKRGEPRGKGSGKGDCIDCGLCVRVCPTGIDIRNGLQLECIQCERCMDACDSIMTNVKRPTGLIKVASSAALANKERSLWKRPRVYVYSAIILFVAALGALRLSSQDAVTMSILRQVGTAYSTMPDGRLSNMFNARLQNHSDQDRPIAIQVVEPADGITLICPQCGSTLAAFSEQLSPIVVVFTKESAGKSLRLIYAGQSTEHVIPLIGPN